LAALHLARSVRERSPELVRTYVQTQTNMSKKAVRIVKMVMSRWNLSSSSSVSLANDREGSIAARRSTDAALIVELYKLVAIL
jgi:hypothetical protein